MSIGAVCLVAACLPHKPGADSTARPKTSESEWAAAADLATTLARAAGADRIAPPQRISQPGTVSRRHITLASPGCYHAGIAWLSSVDLDAQIAIDAGATPPTAPPVGVKPTAQQFISAPGGALDFCTDKAGGAWLTLREVTDGHAVAAPPIFEYAVVYGSGKDRRHALARAR